MGNARAGQSAFEGKKRQKKVWMLVFAFVALVAFALAWQVKLPALLWHWSGTFFSAREGLWLPAYRVSIEAKPIEGVTRNASGLTHDARTNTLYLAINHPAEILELSTEGRVLRRIPVQGVEDLEGLTHVQDDEFFLIDERHQRIHWISIRPETTSIDVANAPQMGLGVLLNGNLGFEGVTWSSGRDMLFVAKEKAPPRVFLITGLRHDARDDKPLNLQIHEWRPKVEPGRFLLDLSSLSLHDRTGHLLVLSDESRFLVEYAKSGEIVSMMPLWRGWHGLKRSIPQAEGVTTDTEGALYIVSEPNLFYRFAPPQKDD